MDISPEYIKMCSKAKEVQALEPDNDDCKNWYLGLPYRKEYWLPRQDQLQAMVEVGAQLLIIFHGDCWASYPINDSRNPVVSYPSMEQLWLAFVMKEKYNKTWSDESWQTSTQS